MVKFLLSSGANPSISNRFSHTLAVLPQSLVLYDELVDLLEFSPNKNKRGLLISWFRSSDIIIRSVILITTKTMKIVDGVIVKSQMYEEKIK